LHNGDDCKQTYLALYSSKERCLPRNAEMCCTISELELPVNTLPDKIVQKKSLKVKGLDKMLKEGIQKNSDSKLFFKTCREVIVLLKGIVTQLNINEISIK